MQNKPLLFHLLGEASISANVLISMGNQCFYGYRGTDSGSLQPEEAELIEEVFDVFGQYSAWKLRNMTHEENPWIDHEANADVMPHEEIKEYFKTRIK